jgi:hypothetical protein
VPVRASTGLLLTPVSQHLQPRSGLSSIRDSTLALLLCLVLLGVWEHANRYSIDDSILSGSLNLLRLLSRVRIARVASGSFLTSV